MTAPEATAFEYAMGLFSVLIGLAVADIATSFHRLMRARNAVRWDPLALAAAFYTLCIAVSMWFDIWGVRHFGATRHFFFYLGLVAQLFVLFLIAAASLPDEANHDLLDLREYYAHNRRYFWSLQLLFQIGYTAFGIYFSADEIARLSAPVAELAWTLMTAPVAISLVLFVVRSRVVHYIGLGLLFAVMALHYAPMQIN
jgi:hypothetical protein